MEDAPSPEGAAGVGTTTDEAGTLGAGGAGVLVEDEARFSFQKLEDEVVVVSGLTTSHVSGGAEAVEASRWSQVALLFVTGFSVSAAAFTKAGVLCSIVGLSLTVALRVIVGFFFDLSLSLISSGSSETSCLSRPTIHHKPEDFLWTLIDSVFLSSMSPIRRHVSQMEKRGRGGAKGAEEVSDAHPMFFIAILNLFQSHL
jgi:hypothetical protein